MMMMMMMMLLLLLLLRRKRRREEDQNVYWQPLVGKNPARVLLGNNTKGARISQD